MVSKRRNRLAHLEPRPPMRHASAMDSLPHPLAFLLLLISGWVNRQQQAVIDYLLEENRILRAAHASRRVRLTDDQRRLCSANSLASAFQSRHAAWRARRYSWCRPPRIGVAITSVCSGRR
jgi:hypothetical protein